MADVKKIATRESYGNALVEIGKENPNLVVLDADLAAEEIDDSEVQIPKRLWMGIQNAEKLLLRDLFFPVTI